MFASYIIILPIYLLLMNLIAFSAMGIDKHKAKKGLWRIPEKRLFLWVILGGGIGGCVGMYQFRHKTKHSYFVIGFPLITALEYAMLLYLCIHFHLF